mgnify:FL=1
MKRRNFNKSILQQGGLMIEALAMLGLIAVVTPTMYKKSAERTMEVEDINTAATIRTINAAANDYVSANYSTILGDMVKNTEYERELDPRDLRAYLPYGFDIEKALYNYDGANIKLTVSRPVGSNNLTTLMLFPAKMDADNGIGQERTARIAALIGSSGGYVTDSHKARGIGGIWKLEGGDFTKNFKNVDPNTYSIVTASADTISASAGNEMDYSKYLQRGQDPDDTNSQWKNTMRTDLYMGGPEGSSEDVYREATGPHSIRNINSLIVGANTSGGVDGEGNDLADAGGYGLYVAPGAANPNAYIHGSLEAGNGQLNADENNLKYGTGTDDAGNSWVGFNVDKEGTISNLKDLNLAKKAGNWTSILIGALENDGDDKNYIIKAQPRDGESLGKVSLLGDDIVSLSGYASKDNYMPYPNRRKASSDRVVILNNGWKTDENLQPIDEPQYNSEPSFPMRVGANAKYQGILAAGQLDTQKIRAASLSVGSEKIDDENKWMTVDKDGILITKNSTDTDGNTKSGTRINVNKDQISLRVDATPQSIINERGIESTGHAGQIVMNNTGTVYNTDGSERTVNAAITITSPTTDIRGTEDLTISGKGTIVQAMSENSKSSADTFKNTVPDNTLLLRNDGMQMKMSSKAGSVKDKNSNDNPINISETVFSPRNNRDSAYTRTSFQNMHVDLKDSNFRIVNDQNRSIFSVRGNNNEEDKFGSNNNNNDLFTRNMQNVTDVKKNIANNYDIALHGNVVISPLIPNNSTGFSATSYHANVSIGTLNKNAGVNILDKRYDYNDILSETASSGYNRNQNNVVIIDQGFDENADYNNNNKKDIVDPGTVYIRKGYVEVHGEDTANTSGHSYNDAYHGNGVLVASRLVANNPSPDKTTKTTVPYGHEVPQMFESSYITEYNTTLDDKGKEVVKPINRYDTYMVNPAYTSVMHDIKLTTRGGARLSDILPDFINKGIYVVSNTISEEYNKDHTEEGKLIFNGYIKIVDDKTTSLPEGNGNKYSISSKEDINFSTERAWASPFLGAVPAPQCPPGYGRVITLSPYSFEMAQAGVLNKTKRFYDDPLSTGENGIKNDAKDSYYVMPVNNANEVKSSLTPPEYAKANVVSASDADIQIDATNSSMGTINGTLDKLDGLSTQQYVLSSPTATDSSTTPVKPLFFQQSTRIKSATVPLVKGMKTSIETEPSKLNGEYVQGWAAIIGFIYPAKMYSAFTGNDNSGFYWNLFPVMRGTINGYATVYCYFDRTNMYKRYSSDYDNYIEKQDYMKTMDNVPDSHKKTDSNYTKRLNDPDMKYNEVW